MEDKFMKVVTYMCENCFEPYIFNTSKNNDRFLCPKCGEELMYWCTEEIDTINNKLISRYDENERKQKNPGKPIIVNFNKNFVECPYCHSTDTKKISGVSKAGGIALFGVFALSKAGKQWHCNKCKSDF